MNNIGVIEMARAAPPPQKTESVQTPKGEDDFKKYLEACSQEDEKKKAVEQPEDEAVKNAANAAAILLQMAPVQAEPVKVEVVDPNVKPAAVSALPVEVPVEVKAEAKVEAAPIQPESAPAKAEAGVEVKPFTENLKAAAGEEKVDAQKAAAPKVEAAPTMPVKVEAPKAEVVVNEKPVVKAAPVESVETTSTLGNTENVSGRVAVDLSAVKEQAKPLALVNQLSVDIKSMVTAGKNSLHIQIQPENMGRIDVHLISKSDGMQVVMTADSSATSKMLENNLSQLQKSLSEAGLNISGLSVNSQGLQGQFSRNELAQAIVMPHSFQKQPEFANVPVETITARYASTLSGFDFRV